MINIKKERNKIIRDLKYGERIGVIKYSEGKKILDKFDNNCILNSKRFNKSSFNLKKITGLNLQK